jgi:penicillin V acylase-like amidase (Ntn superfamily)
MTNDSSNQLNEIFHTFAGLFIGAVSDDSDIAVPEKLNRKDLDFSIVSLKEVNEYLKHILNNLDKIPNKQLENTVLWGGAYLGEVIKNISKQEFHWVDYNEHVSLNPSHSKAFEEGFTNRTLLSSSSHVTSPVDKIARYLTDGEEHNVIYYAEQFLQ